MMIDNAVEQESAVSFVINKVTVEFKAQFQVKDSRVII